MIAAEKLLALFLTWPGWNLQIQSFLGSLALSSDLFPDTSI